MNQIPNIEKTYNTREVEEKKYPSHKELDMEKYYRIVKSGSFDNMFNYGFEVGKAFHQQLQKARQDWLREEIVKLEGMKQEEPDEIDYDGTGLSQYGFNSALQTIIDRYLLELKSIAQN